MNDFQEFIAGQIKARPVEATMIRKIVKALKDNGTPVVKTWDREEYEEVSTIEEIFEVAFNLDEVYLMTAEGSYVYLIMGQEYESLTDYTSDLDTALAPVSEWIDKNLD